MGLSVCFCGKLSARVPCSSCSGARRGTTKQRGYGHDWRKCRERYLDDNPTCEDCEAMGVVVPAVDVHHVEPIAEAPELRLEPSNLIALCKGCHRVRHGKPRHLEAHHRTRHHRTPGGVF